jgi:hypothetical protein
MGILTIVNSASIYMDVQVSLQYADLLSFVFMASMV